MVFLYIFSEHSRHWFFRGRLVVDNEEVPTSLFKMIMSTQENSNKNNVIQFSDNSRYLSQLVQTPTKTKVFRELRVNIDGETK